jgi:hypothetical protein
MAVDRRVVIGISQVMGLGAALADKLDRPEDEGGGLTLPHAATHETGGSDPIDSLDASVLTTGTLNAARLPAGTVNATGTPIAGQVAVFSDADTLTGSPREFVDKTGTPAANQLALFSDVDTIKGDPALTFTPTGQPTLNVTAPANSEPVITLTETGQVAKGRIWKNRANGAAYFSRNLSFDGSAFQRDDATKLAFLLGMSETSVHINVMDLAGTQINAFRAGGDGVNLIRFTPTHIPSADPYTLDDYREVTASPTLGATSGTAGYTVNTATLRKFGGGAIATGRIVLSSKGSLSGNIMLRGLPFPVGAIWAPIVMVVPQFANFATGVQWLAGYANPSTTDIMLTRGGLGGGSQPVVDGDLTNSSEFVFAVIYITT